jgi:biopolymer transport protein ExbD
MNRLSRTKKHNNDTALPTISLTPLIDTVLVLLVIFMVTTPGKTTAPLLSGKGDKVEHKQPVWVVEIDQRGHLYLDNKFITYKTLVDTISAQMSKDKGVTTSVFVHAHGDAPQEAVTTILNGLRRLKHVGILVG